MNRILLHLAAAIVLVAPVHSQSTPDADPMPGATAAPVAAPAQPHGGVEWIQSYREGMEQARASGRPVLLDFSAEWCGPCRMLERTTFPAPAVAALLEQLVCIHVDIDREQDTALAWRVQSIPRVFVLNVHGQVIGDQLGFLPPERFAPFLADALKNAETRLTEAQEAPQLPAERNRRALAEQLAAASDDDTLTSAVAHLIGLPEPDERRDAVGLLTDNTDRVHPVLMKLLADPHLAIRVGALEALGRLNKPRPDFDPWQSTTDREESLQRLLTLQNNPPGQR
jgi:thiol-disulfide isomerase/thioredoxin